jgi:uncharacterized protein with ParB-like and HNH nuclease domain
VKATLDRIWKHEYLLPAIQREFVWNPKQICKLFDSLMQGFPVGSFLFWKIEPSTSKNFRFFSQLENKAPEDIVASIRLIGYDVVRSRVPDELVIDNTIYLESASIAACRTPRTGQ